MEKNSGRFIVFEGICGSGKTTTANLLTKSNNNYIYSKGAVYTPSLKKASEKSLFNHSDALYVADAQAQTVNDIASIIKTGKNIIQDKYVDSIISYSNSCNKLRNITDYSIEPLIRFLEKEGLLLVPCVYIYFYAEKKQIIERIKRNNTKTHEFYLSNLSMIDLMLEEFESIINYRRNNSVNLFKVDTTELSEKETLNKITNIILNTLF